MVSRRIIRNESWLRDKKDGDWKKGLIRLSTHAKVVFDGSTLSQSARTLRRAPVTGYTILDARRAKSIDIQPSVERFASTFELLTDGLLKGLNWSNVFVAGGIVLGSLLCIDPAKDAERSKHSDIDIYIYGLGPIQANEKIHEIHATWKSNLSPGAPSVVLRNSRTITFFSSYPTKRVQIVLKLVKDPKEVLLNFDLDVCSVGWDGQEVWLLPRAARALQSQSSFYCYSP